MMETAPNTKKGGALMGLFVIALLIFIPFLLIYKSLYGWVGILKLFGIA